MQDWRLSEIIYFSCCQKPVPFSVSHIPRPRVLCNNEWSCGGRESLGKGVIKADYGEAEGRVGQHICLPHLMSGGRESWISCLAVVSPLPCHFVTRTLLLEDETGSSACVSPGVILTGWWGPCSPGIGNWGTLASSEPYHSASASLNQSKNTQPTHGPPFAEDQLIATLKQSLTPVHERCDTTIFHSLFKFDQCYEAMAI